MDPADLPAPTECPSIGGLPALGLGTYRNDDPEQCAESVATALELGYRHVDTAEAYGNEEAVGRGIARSSVDREDVLVATKVWHSNLDAEGVRLAARRSANRLGVDAIDLLYVHWPAHTYEPTETLPAFAELVDDGLVRHVGVSNFEPDQLEAALEVLDGAVLANQIECHPLLPQRSVRAACAENDVTVVGYSPIVRGAVFDHPVVTSVADAYGASPAQVSLAWLRQRDVVAIPKATGRDHLAENWASLSLELEDDALERLDGIDERTRVVDPEFGPWD